MMDSSGTGTEHRATTNAHFPALLARLRASELSAEVAYERLRARLIAFFRLHLPAQAEALADEALDRFGRRLCEGTIVDSPSHYALGIARLLLLEAQARLHRERRTVDEEARRATLHEPDDDALRHAQAAALDACLASLAREDAALILDYYGADGAARIRRRQQLADALGLSLNALRNRALRLRNRLEECALSRLAVMKRAPESPAP
jgi:DNA-directed RNA polymerase specialized sigma24 family protein